MGKRRCWEEAQPSNKMIHVVYCLILGSVVLAGGIGWAGFMMTQRELDEVRSLLERSRAAIASSKEQFKLYDEMLQEAKTRMEEVRKERERTGR